MELYHSNLAAAEPPSSGFTSPVEHADFHLQINDGPVLSSSPALESVRDPSRKQEEPPSEHNNSVGDLEHPMVTLRMSDDDMEVDLVE